MTPLTKPIYRVTAGEYSTLFPKPRQIVVGLDPRGDLLVFREKGRKGKWCVPIADIFAQVVRREALAKKKAKRKKKTKLF